MKAVKAFGLPGSAHNKAGRIKLHASSLVLARSWLRRLDRYLVIKVQGRKKAPEGAVRSPCLNLLTPEGLEPSSAVDSIPLLGHEKPELKVV